MDICKHLRPLYNMRHCSRCQGNTEFYCRECSIDLCSMCKEKHCIDLDSKDHEHVIYRNKVIYPSEQTACKNHPDYVYEMFCKLCAIPICALCVEHAQHENINILTALELKKRQHNKIIGNIRSDALYNRHVLLANIRTELKSRQRTNLCSQVHSELKTKCLTVKDLIEKVVFNDKSRHRCLIQKITMQSHLAGTEENEYLFEQSAKTPVKFLSFVKKTGIAQGQENIPLNKHGILSLTDRLDSEAVNQLLGAMIEKRKRLLENEYLIRVMPTVLCKTSFQIKPLQLQRMIPQRQCQGLGLDQIWFSERDKLFSTNTKDETINEISYDLSYSLYFRSTYTITREQELIYLNKNGNIVKISRDMESTILPIITDSFFRPHSIYCSPYSGELLIGMLNSSTNDSKLAKYNIKADRGLPKHPDIICNIENWDSSLLTDNINGDIIAVGFLRGLKGMDRAGQHRFYYTETASGYPLIASGICTDTLSHILVSYGSTVLMLNKDGQFISYLMTLCNETPIILKFDYKKHLLWIRDKTYMISAYRYIERQDVLTGSDITLSP